VESQSPQLDKSRRFLQRLTTNNNVGLHVFSSDAFWITAQKQ